MNKETKLLREQMELLYKKSQDCEASDLSKLTNDMLNVNLCLRQNLAQRKKRKGGYDGEVKIKTKIDQSAVKKLSKKIRKMNKNLKKTVWLMKKAGK